jgi:hypothetical protein
LGLEYFRDVVHADLAGRVSDLLLVEELSVALAESSVGSFFDDDDCVSVMFLSHFRDELL